MRDKVDIGPCEASRFDFESDVSDSIRKWRANSKFSNRPKSAASADVPLTTLIVQQKTSTFGLL